MYKVTKTYPANLGLSACFRQWRAKSHCRFMHGYALEVRLHFHAQHLDSSGWVIDFGCLKPIKEWLVETFDHKTLVAEDDPSLEMFEQLDDAGLIDIYYVKATGCEAFAKMIFEHVIESGIMDGRKCWLQEVEVFEHAANGASYDGRDG